MGSWRMRGESEPPNFRFCFLKEKAGHPCTKGIPVSHTADLRYFEIFSIPSPNKDFI